MGAGTGAVVTAAAVGAGDGAATAAATGAAEEAAAVADVDSHTSGAPIALPSWKQ